MLRLLIIFGVVLAVALTVIYVIVMLYREHKNKPRKMENNEYDVYPQDDKK